MFSVEEIHKEEIAEDEIPKDEITVEEILQMPDSELLELPPPPICLHGPTLVFTKEHDELVRKYKKRKLTFTVTSPYYACSASRDQKFCSFRMDQIKWLQMHQKDRDAQDALRRADMQSDEYAYILDIYEDKEENDKGTFAFCHDCCRILVNPKADSDEELPKFHRFDLHLTYRCAKVTSNHQKSFFANPTKLARAATSNEGQAQFFFSDDVVPFVIDEIIIKSEYRKVLCIGCPSIHEKIVEKYSDKGILSFLLDIDPRFRQFWPAHQFAQFNMFNYYFFDDPHAEEYLRIFLHANGITDDTIIIIDPPFGGRIEYLAVTVRKLQILMTNSDQVEKMPFPPMILFFPYFNEHWITRAFYEEVLITDQIVHYINHNKLGKRASKPSVGGNAAKSKKNQPPVSHEINTNSPVRIFTNLSRSTIDLSSLNEDQKGDEPFYRWCDICSRFVFRLNKHCFDCNECSARDSSKAYNHCKVCNICVKSTWFHCTNCARCHLKSARCG